jgi:hypothetical protein
VHLEMAGRRGETNGCARDHWCPLALRSATSMRPWRYWAGVGCVGTDSLLRMRLHQESMQERGKQVHGRAPGATARAHTVSSTNDNVVSRRLCSMHIGPCYLRPLRVGTTRVTRSAHSLIVADMRYDLITKGMSIIR